MFTHLEGFTNLRGTPEHGILKRRHIADEEARGCHGERRLVAPPDVATIEASAVPQPMGDKLEP